MTSPAGDVPSLLIQAAREMRRLKLQALEPYGISPHQSRALHVIAETPTETELRPSSIAEALHIAPRSATEVIDALESRELIHRAPSTSDRRAIAIRLTDKGRNLHDKLETDRHAQNTHYVSALTTREQATLAALLTKLTNSVNTTPC